MSKMRCIFVSPTEIAPGVFPDPPPPSPCTRIATAQRDVPSSMYEPTAFVWRGTTSGATGNHVAYGYEPPGFGFAWQQYLILSGVVGTFIDDEPLEFDPNGLGSFQAFGFNTRATSDGGVAQTPVNCDAGMEGIPGGQIGFEIDEEGEGFAASEVYDIDTEEDYSAVLVAKPTEVEGRESGNRANFISWGVGTIRVVNVRHGRSTLSWVPGEFLTFTPTIPETIQLANPHNASLVSR